MPESPARLRSHLTLILCTILHAFTHAYGAMLVPLYLLMVRDLKLPGVSRASLIVTVSAVVYCLVSYMPGILADRFNRKALLGIGLLGNALAILAMGVTRRYDLIMAYAVLAGLFGALFHPSANALVPAHYPKSPGMAIGLLGMGSGIGFFAGPQFAGWRAQAAAGGIVDRWLAVADWQRPLVEAGFVGTIVGLIFLLIAREAHGHAPKSESRPLGTRLAGRISLVAALLMWRDFAGIATLSLTSIYLQKAHGLDARHTGFILGAIMLMSVIVSPVAVYLSSGRRRLPTLGMVLVAGALSGATVPLWPVRNVLAILMTFMTFQLGSYAVSDAAILERVAPAVRGRVVGLFLTIAGTFSSTAPFVMGFWTDRLGRRASEPAVYLPLFVTIALMMVAACGCLPLIARLGDVQGAAIDPLTETTPATVEPAL
jgi:MFS family permease